MRVKTKSTAPKPSLEQARIVLSQIHLLTALEELTDIRQTMRLQSEALAELREKPNLPPAVVTELLATVQRRDRKFDRRLANVQTSVNKASRLLLPTDGKSGAAH